MSDKIRESHNSPIFELSRLLPNMIERRGFYFQLLMEDMNYNEKKALIYYEYLETYDRFINSIDTIVEEPYHHLNISDPPSFRKNLKQGKTWWYRLALGI